MAHEEQHQELILTDLLHLFSCNPLNPVYRPLQTVDSGGAHRLTWFDYPGGLCEIGHAAPTPLSTTNARAIGSILRHGDWPPG